MVEIFLEGGADMYISSGATLTLSGPVSINNAAGINHLITVMTPIAEDGDSNMHGAKKCLGST